MSDDDDEISAYVYCDNSVMLLSVRSMFLFAESLGCCIYAKQRAVLVVWYWRWDFWFSEAPENIVFVTTK